MKLKRYVELFIFNIRWLLLFFYVKLAWDIVLLAYVNWAATDIDPHLILHFIEDVDIAMLAGLIEMIITGGYNSFVAKDHGYSNKNISSGELKIKMGTSIIGISSIHLLKLFMADHLTMQEVWMKTIIHSAFIVGALALALIDFLHCKTEQHEAPSNPGNPPVHGVH